MTSDERADIHTLIGTLQAMARHVREGDRWAIGEAADRLAEQAETITHLTADYEAVKSRLELLEDKLPRYADTGRAFVPERDTFYVFSFGKAKAVDAKSPIPWHYSRTYYCYSTAAACEEAEGKAARETEGGE